MGEPTTPTPAFTLAPPPNAGEKCPDCGVEAPPGSVGIAPCGKHLATPPTCCEKPWMIRGDAGWYCFRCETPYDPIKAEHNHASGCPGCVTMKQVVDILTDEGRRLTGELAAVKAEVLKERENAMTFERLAKHGPWRDRAEAAETKVAKLRAALENVGSIYDNDRQPNRADAIHEAIRAALKEAK